MPEWVKTNTSRFPRAKLRKTADVIETADVLSIFHTEGRDADAKAFQTLMAHIKDIDEATSTVLMVQVENEPGILGSPRDVSEAANKVFTAPVPEDLVDFLTNQWDTLHEDLKVNLTDFQSRKSSVSDGAHWEEVLGSSPQTAEQFMAYHYAKYIDYVASKGKEVYPLPLYTNVWLNYNGEDADNGTTPIVAAGGGQPGDYPSGGATSNVLDIWQRFAPNLDFIGPDIYLTSYDKTCDKYRHRGQPLFIPEQRRDDYGARRIWVAYGSHAALGVAPFGIDTVDAADCPFREQYGLLQSVSSHVLKAQRSRGSSVGFYFDPLNADGSDPSAPVTRRWGNFTIIIERCFVFGTPGPGWGMVIYRDDDDSFLLIGSGFQVRAESTHPDSVLTGILRFEEKIVDRETGELKPGRRLNGDETRSGRTAMMPSRNPDYAGFPISITIPARTMIAEVKFYSLEE